MTSRILQPAGWPRPKGYSNGFLASGQTIWVAGQIGWDTEGKFAPDLGSQTELALRNIAAVLAEADATPQHIVRMTWFLTDVADYQANLPAIGAAYGRVMGRHFPAMTVVQVVRLVEAEALIEIEAVAVLPS
jgi:enamine deaminase RidA (YjgF/YER057c/UK114 family)